MNLQQAPKQFCENIKVGYSEEYFVAALLSGQNAHVFAFTPEHAKRLYQYLGHNLEKYEKQYGEIKAEWVDGVKSPIQSVDIEKGGKEEEDKK